jgi:hypothetical protein
MGKSSKKVEEIYCNLANKKKTQNKANQNKIKIKNKK